MHVFFLALYVSLRHSTICSISASLICIYVLMFVIQDQIHPARSLLANVHLILLLPGWKFFWQLSQWISITAEPFWTPRCWEMPIPEEYQWSYNLFPLLRRQGSNFWGRVRLWVSIQAFPWPRWNSSPFRKIICIWWKPQWEHWRQVIYLVRLNLEYTYVEYTYLYWTVGVHTYVSSYILS